MADSVDEAQLLGLPAELNDIFTDNEHFFNKNDSNIELGPSHSFPTEFPYEFDSFGSSSAVSSPVESVVGSTETESSDEEDFFAGLTRRLTQCSFGETQQLPNKTEWVMSGSPQSTLSGIGSWSFKSFSSENGSPNGVCSPPTTPFGARNDTWDLIYKAAGQVARLKMCTEVPNKCTINNININNNNQNKGLLGPPRSQQNLVSPNNSLYCNHGFTHNLANMNQYQYMRQEQVMKQQQHHQQCVASSLWGRQQVKVGVGGWQAPQPQPQTQQIQSRVRNSTAFVDFENGINRCGTVRPSGLPQSAWPPLQVQTQYDEQQQQLVRPQLSSGSGMRAVFLHGSGGGCGGGGGVKRECAGTGVFLPRRYGNPAESRKKSGCSTVLLPAKVVQALNLSLEDLNGHGLSHAHQKVNPGLPPNYDAFLARRNAVLTQQKRSLRQEAASLNQEIRLPQEWTY